jgi:hypothetical protein
VLSVGRFFLCFFSPFPLAQKRHPSFSSPFDLFVWGTI